MTQGTAAGQWNVFFEQPNATTGSFAEGPIDIRILHDILTSAQVRNRMRSVPFFIGPDGHAESLINAFFVRRTDLAINTRRTYAYAIRVWLNYLHMLDVDWRDATAEDLGDFHDWRLLDVRNERRVAGSTWDKQLAALSTLYRWASRVGIPNPTVDLDGHRADSRYSRSSNVKWFQPQAYRQWRDLSLLGFLPDGREDTSFRGRNVQRDSAFADLLFGTGLRVREGGTLLLGLEWPVDRDATRRFYSLRLADSVAKGGVGRSFWAPREAVNRTLAYVEGERAESIRKARAAGTYDLMDALTLVSVRDRTLVVVDRAGEVRDVTLDSLTESERLRLLQDTPFGVEPVALWLNGDGLPRRHERWSKTFDRANQRIADLGVPLSRLTPHMLRHSFALRWFVVGAALWRQRVGHLTEEETRDLRDQCGDQWGLVQTMLGHRNPETTRNIYLEPFTALDVELLLDHSLDEATEDLLRALITDHPRVQSSVESA